ncbi:hypothetical protein [Ectobacillus funiculus]|jgi:hypothetical protein|uniref:Spore coat protein D n=1 Tax=Ectobacillus funiculus TaxID=137993 RepID=A0ABV5WAI8_9BACI
MYDNRNNKCIYCDPQYIVNDRYTEREVTYVHPIVHVNREHIVYVPRHVYEEHTINEVIDPGYPDGCGCNQKKKNCGWSWI